MRCLPTVESYIFLSMKFRGFLNYDVFVDSSLVEVLFQLLFIVIWNLFFADIWICGSADSRNVHEIVPYKM